MSFGSGEIDPSQLPGGGSSARSPSAPANFLNQVTFNRRELNRILDLYGRMVAAGEWRDYAIDFLKDRAVFSVFRRSSEVPLYRIEKNPKLEQRQGAYSVISATGHILRRGHRARPRAARHRQVGALALVGRPQGFVGFRSAPARAASARCRASVRTCSRPPANVPGIAESRDAMQRRSSAACARIADHRDHLPEAALLRASVDQPHRAARGRRRAGASRARCRSNPRR